jgi:nucleoside-diphosphate-sugar epimerase
VEFIGSALVHRLFGEKHELRVVDNFSTGFKSNLAGVLDKIELIEGDLAERAVAESAVHGTDYVLHQAAIPSVQRSIEDPLLSNRANVTATLNILLAARDARVKRLVFASSSAVYGETEVLTKVETMRESPVSPYALTKLAGEKYCIIIQRIFSLATVSLHYFNVFGPWQNPSSPYSGVISRFIKAALDRTRPTVFGDGEQFRDFTYVENVVEVNLCACRGAGVEGKVFNVGVGERHSLNDLLKVLGSAVGRQLNPQYAEPRPGDVRHSLADISAARELLKYDPQVSFSEGVRRTVEWFRHAGRAVTSG